MIPFKIIGCVLVLLGGAVTARQLNRALDGRLSRLECLVSLLKFFRLQIDCYCVPVGEIFRRADKELLEGCGLSGVPSSFAEFMSSLDPPPDPEIGNILTSFERELGASYRDDQLKSCDYHISRLSEIYSAAVLETQKRKKLNRTLCFSATAAVVILLI